ncbi:MAG: hypothetical protein EAX96_12510 [Candidatus Lokiarchaeota archaeon]|nr:hypothetical protein [Candidatus Lokiarchaeota archaeon]
MVDLDPLFYPRGVAIIGVSDNPIKGATAHLYALKKVNYQGPIYCISKTRKEVMFGEKTFPSILDVPDPIDYVIIGVPNESVPKVLNECSQKGVKFCTIFTAGFSELGTEEGIKLERAMLDNVTNGLRLIGPNCLGPYCQESRLTNTEIMEIIQSGEVAFLSQSGGHTGSFFQIGEHRGFPFNKVVSIGNQIDLTIQDFIEYFSKDEKIKVISIYLEKIKKLNEFRRIIETVSRKKPLIFWKGGRTKAGIKAAASHTGAISSSYDIFKSAINQMGGIIAESIEELADLTLGSLYLSKKHLGNNIGIVVPGGGSAVEMTDEAAKYGFKLPELSQRTQDNIQSFIQKINTNVKNPIDMGVLGWIPINYGKTIAFMAEDPNIDIITFYFMIERLPKFIERMQDKHLTLSFIRAIKKATKNSDKPFICILPNFVVTIPEDIVYRKEFTEGLISIGIPYFSSMERAMNVVSKLRKYQDYVKIQKK